MLHYKDLTKAQMGKLLKMWEKGRSMSDIDVEYFGRVGSHGKHFKEGVMYHFGIDLTQKDARTIEKEALEARIKHLEAEIRILEAENARLKKSKHPRRITDVSVGSSLVGATRVK